jgi:hypothetical protein
LSRFKRLPFLLAQVLLRILNEDYSSARQRQSEIYLSGNKTAQARP